MNTQQTTDLIAWLKNQEETLPESLANILIEDCLEELKNSEETSKKLGLLCDDRFNGICIYEEGSRTFRYWLFQDYSNKDKVYIIQTLLSQKDGKAVLEFLEVPNKEIELEYKKRGLDKIKFGGKDLQLARLEFSFWAKEQPKTLQTKLLEEFVLNGTGIGKTFDQALEIITKIYLVQRYV
jgi:hypothetical protein